MRSLKTITTMLLLALSMAAFAQKGTKMDLWPNGAPNDNGDSNDKAELTVYLPDAKKATGRAVVCCPGGGYSHLAMDHEGHQWATFFNSKGIALIVLKYRMPHGNFNVPISDAEEAIRTVRRNAVDWHINHKDVGIMGFSAGGHLASTIATHSKDDAAPNFQILFYPVISLDPAITHAGSAYFLLGAEPSQALRAKYCNEKQVTADTPPAFIMANSDDTVVPCENSMLYYQALRGHGVPAALHIYPTGGHGWADHLDFAYRDAWMADLKIWLSELAAAK